MSDDEFSSSDTSNGSSNHSSLRLPSGPLLGGKSPDWMNKFTITQKTTSKPNPPRSNDDDDEEESDGMNPPDWMKTVERVGKTIATLDQSNSPVRGDTTTTTSKSNGMQQFRNASPLEQSLQSVNDSLENSNFTLSTPKPTTRVVTNDRHDSIPPPPSAPTPRQWMSMFTAGKMDPLVLADGDDTDDSSDEPRRSIRAAQTTTTSTPQSGTGLIHRRPMTQVPDSEEEAEETDRDDDEPENDDAPDWMTRFRIPGVQDRQTKLSRAGSLSRLLPKSPDMKVPSSPVQSHSQFQTTYSPRKLDPPACESVKTVGTDGAMAVSLTGTEKPDWMIQLKQKRSMINEPEPSKTIPPWKQKERRKEEQNRKLIEELGSSIQSIETETKQYKHLYTENGLEVTRLYKEDHNDGDDEESKGTDDDKTAEWMKQFKKMRLKDASVLSAQGRAPQGISRMHRGSMDMIERSNAVYNPSEVHRSALLAEKQKSPKKMGRERFAIDSVTDGTAILSTTKVKAQAGARPNKTREDVAPEITENMSTTVSHGELKRKGSSSGHSTYNDQVEIDNSKPENVMGMWGNTVKAKPPGPATLMSFRMIQNQAEKVRERLAKAKENAASEKKQEAVIMDDSDTESIQDTFQNNEQVTAGMENSAAALFGFKGDTGIAKRESASFDNSAAALFGFGGGGKHSAPKDLAIGMDNSAAALFGKAKEPSTSIVINDHESSKFLAMDMSAAAMFGFRATDTTPNDCPTTKDDLVPARNNGQAVAERLDSDRSSNEKSAPTSSAPSKKESFSAGSDSDDSSDDGKNKTVAPVKKKSFLNDSDSDESSDGRKTKTLAPVKKKSFLDDSDSDDSSDNQKTKTLAPIKKSSFLDDSDSDDSSDNQKTKTPAHIKSTSAMDHSDSDDSSVDQKIKTLAPVKKKSVLDHSDSESSDDDGKKPTRETLGLTVGDKDTRNSSDEKTPGEGAPIPSSQKQPVMNGDSDSDDNDDKKPKINPLKSMDGDSDSDDGDDSDDKKLKLTPLNSPEEPSSPSGNLPFESGPVRPSPALSTQSITITSIPASRVSRADSKSSVDSDSASSSSGGSETPKPSSGVSKKPPSDDSSSSTDSDSGSSSSRSSPRPKKSQPPSASRASDSSSSGSSTNLKKKVSGSKTDGVKMKPALDDSSHSSGSSSSSSSSSNDSADRKTQKTTAQSEKEEKVVRTPVAVDPITDEAHDYENGEEQPSANSEWQAALDELTAEDSAKREKEEEEAWYAALEAMAAEALNKPKAEDTWDTAMQELVEFMQHNDDGGDKTNAQIQSEQTRDRDDNKGQKGPASKSQKGPASKSPDRGKRISFKSSRHTKSDPKSPQKTTRTKSMNRSDANAQSPQKKSNPRQPKTKKSDAATFHTATVPKDLFTPSSCDPSPFAPLTVTQERAPRPTMDNPFASLGESSHHMNTSLRDLFAPLGPTVRSKPSAGDRSRAIDPPSKKDGHRGIPRSPEVKKPTVSTKKKDVTQAVSKSTEGKVDTIKNRKSKKASSRKRSTSAERNLKDKSSGNRSTPVDQTGKDRKSRSRGKHADRSPDDRVRERRKSAKGKKTKKK